MARLKKLLKAIVSGITEYMFGVFKTSKGKLVYTIFTLLLGTYLMVKNSSFDVNGMYVVIVILTYFFLIGCIIKFSIDTYIEWKKKES